MVPKHVYLKRGEGIARFGKIGYPISRFPKKELIRKSNNHDAVGHFGSPVWNSSDNAGLTTDLNNNDSVSLSEKIEPGHSTKHVNITADSHSDISIAEETSSILHRMESERREQLSLLEQQTFEGMEQLIANSSVGSDSSLIRQFLSLGLPAAVMDVEQPVPNAEDRGLPAEISLSSTDSAENLAQQLQLIESQLPFSDSFKKFLTGGSHFAEYFTPSPRMPHREQLSTVTEEASTLEESTTHGSVMSPRLSPVLGSLESRVKKIMDGIGNKNALKTTGFGKYANSFSSPKVVELSDEEDDNCPANADRFDPAFAHLFDSGLMGMRDSQRLRASQRSRSVSFADSSRSSPFIPSDTPPIIRILRQKSGAPTALPTSDHGQNDKDFVGGISTDPQTSNVVKSCDCDHKIKRVSVAQQSVSQTEVRELTKQLKEILTRIKQEQSFVDEMKAKYETTFRNAQAEKAELEQARYYFEEWKKKETARLKADTIRLGNAEKAAHRVIKRENEEIKILQKRFSELEHEKCETEARWCDEKSSRKEEKVKIRKEMEALRLDLERMKRRNDRSEKENTKLNTEVQQLRVRLRNATKLTVVPSSNASDTSNKNNNNASGLRTKSASTGRLSLRTDQRSRSTYPESGRGRSRSEDREQIPNKFSRVSSDSYPLDRLVDPESEQCLPTPISTPGTSSSRKQVRFSLVDDSHMTVPGSGFGAGGADECGRLETGGPELISIGNGEESVCHNLNTEQAWESGVSQQCSVNDETFVKLPYSPNSPDFDVVSYSQTLNSDSASSSLPNNDPTSSQGPEVLVGNLGWPPFHVPFNPFPFNGPPYPSFSQQTCGLTNSLPGLHPPNPSTIYSSSSAVLRAVSSVDSVLTQAHTTSDASVETSDSLVVGLTDPRLAKGGIVNLQSDSSQLSMNDDVSVDEVFLDNNVDLQASSMSRDCGGRLMQDVKKAEPKKVLEKNFADGSTEIHYANGTIELCRPNSGGASEEWIRRFSYANGDVMELLGDGSKSYAFQSSGLKEVVKPNGDKNLTSASGRRKTYLHNGTKKWTLEDGTEIERQSDGTVVRVKPDGTKYVKSRLFKSVTRPDGWTWTQDEDNGQQRFLDPAGKVVRASNMPKRPLAERNN